MISEADLSKVENEYNKMGCVTEGAVRHINDENYQLPGRFELPSADSESAVIAATLRERY
eukprot:6175838-Pleurochrysis_carterae.AAC.1